MARPMRPHHTVEQKRHDIACLTERISELESSDPSEQPYGPEVAKLQNAIDETIAAVFGRGTAEYNQYKPAAQLEHRPVVDYDTPRWKFSLGGVYGPEIQARERAKQHAAQSKQQSLRLLQQAVGQLKQELERQPVSESLDQLIESRSPMLSESRPIDSADEQRKREDEQKAAQAEAARQAREQKERPQQEAEAQRRVENEAQAAAEQRSSMSNDASAQTLTPKPTLVDLMIILVICSAITIFVFWISTRFLRLNLFEQLPDFIVGSFGYLTALGTGTVGLGALVIKSLGWAGKPQPDYLKLIGICEGSIFALIVGVVVLDKLANPPPPAQPPPESAYLVNLRNPDVNPTSFRLKSDPYLFAIAYNFSGSYLVRDGKLDIKINGGKMTVSSLVTPYPNLFPMKLEVLILGLCYNTPGANRNFYPRNSDASRLVIDRTIDVGGELEIPPGEVSFNIPTNIQRQAAWLCGQLFSRGGAYMPSE